MVFELAQGSVYVSFGFQFSREDGGDPDPFNLFLGGRHLLDFLDDLIPDGIHGGDVRLHLVHGRPAHSAYDRTVREVQFQGRPLDQRF